ncbi:hypothetical protein diail_2294 [Diaporthe ilicicola]|nr:hypothetical protein diail_2294 [Diaporthe ilicicola]
MQIIKLSVFLAFVAAAIATPVQLNTRSLYSCYKDVAADQVDCFEACGDTSATDCTNAWYVLSKGISLSSIKDFTLICTCSQLPRCDSGLPCLQQELRTWKGRGM